MPQPTRLELHLSVPAGREREAALTLLANTPRPGWLILVALAAELVSLHESQSQGETTVLVVPQGAATSALRDLVKGR